jgi:hypothetical protein
MTPAITTAIIAEEDEQRRRSCMGLDQQLVKSKYSVDETLEKIAGTYEGGYVKNGEMKQKNKNDLSLTFFFIFGFIGVIAAFIFVPPSSSWDLMGVCLDIVIGGIVAVISGIIGVTIKLEGEIKHIKVFTEKNETMVLLKVYNSEGYRSLDEDEILCIKNAIT